MTGILLAHFLTASLISPALTVFLPACNANFTASAATVLPYSSRTSLSAAFALSETRACLFH